MFELIPYGGIGSLGRLRRDMDDLWSRFLDAGEAPASESAIMFAPKVDVKETADAYEVTAETPGMKAEDMDVSLEGNLLTIKGEKKDSREEKEGSYHLVERRFGSFRRSFRLPSEVDRKALKATHKDGVLTIHLPKGQKENSTSIKVNEA